MQVLLAASGELAVNYNTLPKVLYVLNIKRNTYPEHCVSAQPSSLAPQSGWTPPHSDMTGCWQINSILVNIGWDYYSSLRYWS